MKKLQRLCFTIISTIFLLVGCSGPPPATPTPTPSPDALQEAFYDGETVICPLLPSSTDENAPGLFTPEQCITLVSSSLGNDDYGKIDVLSVQLEASQIPDDLKRAFYYGVLNMCLKARTVFGSPSAPLMYTDQECGIIVAQAIENNYFEQRKSLPSIPTQES
jgi:hypothetical protein